MMYEKSWKAFLEKLDLEIEFDRLLKKYLEAIKFVAEINVNNIDDSNQRSKIDAKLEDIVAFIKKYKTECYEIGLIEGFRTNENKQIKGRDYYYYIADQKMKAAVYYVRYLNFLNKIICEQDDNEQKIKYLIEKINQILKNLGKTHIEFILEKADEIIEAIDEELDTTIDEEIWKIRKECIECIEKIKANRDMDYMKYMLFNNMMREIQYIGAAYQYLWHWESKNRNLFRYASYDGGTISIDDGCTKREFLEQMFKSVICHMNNSSGQLCSYSEDPYVDIFKYLKIYKSSDTNYMDISNTNETGIKIEIKNLNNDNTAKFEIIKSVKVNSIKRADDVKDFYSFVQDGKGLCATDQISYAVELYPDLPNALKNSKNTTKNIKSLLETYLSTWGDKETIMSYIADDKEVVTYGNIESYVYDVGINGVPIKYLDGYKYVMELDKEEIIYLLLKLRTSDVNKLVEKIRFTPIDTNMVEQMIRGALSDQNTSGIQIKGKVEVPLSNKKTVIISANAKIEYSFINSVANQNNKKLTVMECKKLIHKKVEEQIKTYFKNRYQTILTDSHTTADFILDFIKEEGHICPEYISEYNEYEPNRGDEEVSMLKYWIFKE